MRNIALVAAGVFAIVAALWGYNTYQARKAAELQLGLDSTRVLSESFRSANQLKVSGIEGWIVAKATDPGLIGVLDVTQTIKAPYSVDYFIDMSKIGLSDFSWNPEKKSLIVEIPDPITAKPNIDMSRAETSQSGVWISRNAGVRLQRKSATFITARATKTANSVDNRKKARDAALDAVRRNALAPLNAAGITGVTIDVRFRSLRNTNDDVWDYTLPYEQVAERIEQMRPGR